VKSAKSGGVCKDVAEGMRFAVMLADAVKS